MTATKPLRLLVCMSARPSDRCSGLDEHPPPGSAGFLGFLASQGMGLTSVACGVLPSHSDLTRAHTLGPEGRHG